MALPSSIGGPRDIGAIRMSCANWAATLDALIQRSDALAGSLQGVTAADFQNMGLDASGATTMVNFVAALPNLRTAAAITTAMSYANLLRDITR